MKIKKTFFALLIGISLSAYCFLTHQNHLQTNANISTPTNELMQVEELPTTNPSFQPDVSFIKKAVTFILRALPAA